MCAKKRDIYIMSNGQPVTEGSVSQLCGILDKPALVPWAAKMTVQAVAEHWLPGKAYDKQYIEYALQESKNAHRRKKDTAGDVGTDWHTLVGAYVEGQLLWDELPEGSAERKALQNFAIVTKDWEWLGSEITLIKEWLECPVGHTFQSDNAYMEHSECTQCVYQDPKNNKLRLYGYGGTADAIARVNGKILLIDFKTSNSVQATYSMQCALYAEATPVGDSAALAQVWREIEEARILHFHKELLTWECLERNIKEHVPYIPHFIGCRRWAKRFDTQSWSTKGDKVTINDGVLTVPSSS